MRLGSIAAAAVLSTLFGLAVASTSSAGLVRAVFSSAGGGFDRPGAKDGFSLGLVASGVAQSATYREVAGHWFWASGSAVAVPPPLDVPQATALLLRGASPTRTPSFAVRLAGPTATSRARLDVLNVSGRHVRSLANGLPIGETIVTWDGATDTGQEAPAGVYFARLDGVLQPITRRFVILR